MPDMILLKERIAGDSAAVALKFPNKKGDAFWTTVKEEAPALITRPLVGLQILDADALGGKQPANYPLDRAKRDYTDLVSAAVWILNDEGHKAPKTWAELSSLCLKASSIVWSNYTYSVTDLAKGLKNGNMDCDTSCFVIGDILRQFGVGVNVVELPGHILLHASTARSEIYLETTTYSAKNGIMEIGAYKSGKDARNRHPDIRGEFSYGATGSYICNYCGDADAAAKRYGSAILYFSAMIRQETDSVNRGTAYRKRGLAKYENKDYKDYLGAIADFNAAIKLNPKDAESFWGRARAEQGIGKMVKKVPDQNCMDALRDYTIAISMDSKRSVAYLGRADLKFFMTNYQGASEDFEKARECFEKEMQESGDPAVRENLKKSMDGAETGYNAAIAMRDEQAKRK